MLGGCSGLPAGAVQGSKRLIKIAEVVIPVLDLYFIEMLGPCLRHALQRATGFGASRRRSTDPAPTAAPRFAGLGAAWRARGPH